MPRPRNQAAKMRALPAVNAWWLDADVREAQEAASAKRQAAASSLPSFVAGQRVRWNARHDPNRTGIVTKLLPGGRAMVLFDNGEIPVRRSWLTSGDAV
jgi:hypothetical protein